MFHAKFQDHHMSGDFNVFILPYIYYVYGGHLCYVTMYWHFHKVLFPLSQGGST